MKNLEIKIKLKESQSLPSLSFAAAKGVLHQKDTYFMLGKYRLKIREEQDRYSLIFYNRADKSETRESKYTILFLSRPFVSIVKNGLDVVLGRKVVVTKKRDLFIFGSTRIHLDKVSELGTFIELETVVSDDSKTSSCKEEHFWVKERLGLEDFEVVPFSYSDLLLNQSKPGIL